VAKQDQHPTIEQLSAYLDGQLSSQELSTWDTHLNTCQECQQTLAELRETVALLHALPQPALPRSFILPVDSVAPRPAPIQPLTPIPLHAVPRRRAWSFYMQGMVRTVSTIAAILGIVFLLSGLIGIGPARGGGASTGGSAQSQAAPASGQQNGALTPSIYGQHKSPTPGTSGRTPAAASGDHPHETPTKPPALPFAQTNPPNAGQFLIHLFDMSTPGGRALLGGLLLVIGLAGFVFFRRL
jgi:hypothetical protein